jgi:hypothetical protein
MSEPDTNVPDAPDPPEWAAAGKELINKTPHRVTNKGNFNIVLIFDVKQCRSQVMD